MSRRNVTCKKGYEHKEYGRLLKELQVKQDNYDTVDDAAALANHHHFLPSDYKESKERHRILSNEKVKYFYSRQDNIIHDKHCIRARLISDEDLLFSEDYISDLEQCPVCELQTYINVGAKDPEQLERYMDFFEKTNILPKQIRNIYIVNNMKTSILLDTITVWHKEDTWRIKSLPKKGHVRLYHNNYVARNNGVREFKPGFHVQNLSSSDTDIGHAINTIKNYNYKPEEYAMHFAKYNSVETNTTDLKLEEKKGEGSYSLPDLPGKKTIRQRIWHKFKKIAKVFYKKKTFFELNNFNTVSEFGYPESETICIYIWKDNNEQFFWQTGFYSQKQKHFSVTYGGDPYIIKQDKVVAWKKMNDEALALELQVVDMEH